MRTSAFPLCAGGNHQTAEGRKCLFWSYLDSSDAGYILKIRPIECDFMIRILDFVLSSWLITPITFATSKWLQNSKGENSLLLECLDDLGFRTDLRRAKVSLWRPHFCKVPPHIWEDGMLNREAERNPSRPLASPPCGRSQKDGVCRASGFLNTWRRTEGQQEHIHGPGRWGVWCSPAPWGGKLLCSGPF